jgi:beta-phosphoglucomutase
MNDTGKKENRLPDSGRNYKAVLFDMDGVILASMEQHLEAWQHAFRKYDVFIDPQEFFHLEGRGVKSVVEDLTAKYGINPGLAPALMESKIRYYDTIYKAEFYDGFFPLLEYLSQEDVKLAIVTGGGRDRVQRLVDEYFQDVFACIVTSDDVQNTKPFPEPYLKAAEKLGVAPRDCIVIENAPLGIRSAKRAGMYVIAIQTTLGSEFLQEADEITQSMFEVRSAVARCLTRNSGDKTQ